MFTMLMVCLPIPFLWRLPIQSYKHSKIYVYIPNVKGVVIFYPLLPLSLFLRVLENILYSLKKNPCKMQIHSERDNDLDNLHSPLF